MGVNPPSSKVCYIAAREVSGMVKKAQQKGVRALKIAALLLLSIEIVYVLAANVFLNAGILQRLINTDPQEIQLDYKWAFSIVPGVAHVRGIAFRIQDSQLQIYFTMSSVTVGVNLNALRHKEFHATNVSGEDLSFRLRFRRVLRPDIISIVKTLPPIPGIEGIGKMPPDNKPPPSNPWRVRLGRVHIKNLYELWIDSVRYAGRATVNGGMFLKPGHEAAVHQSSLDLESGQLSVENVPVLDAISGKIVTELIHSPAEKLEGLELLNRFRGQIQLQSELRSLELLNYSLRETKWAFRGGGKGSLKMNLFFADGAFGENSYLEARSGEIRARLWEHALEGEGLVNWQVERAGADLLSHVRIELENYHMGKSTSLRYPVEGKKFLLEARSRNVHFKKPLSDLAINLKIPRAVITDVGYVNSFLPRQSGVQFMGGSGYLEADLNIDPHRKEFNTGWVTVGAKSVDVAVEQARVRADVEARWKVRTDNWDSSPLDVKGSIIQLKALQTTGEPQGWWANIRVNEGLVNLNQDTRVKGTIAVEARDARPVMDVYLRAQNDSMPGWVKDVLEFRQLRLGFSVEIDDKKFALTDIRAEGDHTELQGWMKNRDDDRRGRFLLKWGPFAAGLRVEGEDVGLRLQDAISWYKQQKSQ